MPEVIELTSSQNSKFQGLRQLRESKWRRRTNRFLIDGSDEIHEALRRGIKIEAIFSAQDFPSEVSAPSYLLPRRLMEKVGYAKRSDQPIAIAIQPDLQLEISDVASAKSILILDQIEKPGNVGACLRTAAACSIDLVVLTDALCEVFNPNTIRTSRGAVFRVPIAVATAEQTQAAIPQEMNILTACVDSRVSLWDCAFSKPYCVVFGNEATGLGGSWRRGRETSFSIPMSGDMDSLNVSISCAITLYEARRQAR